MIRAILGVLLEIVVCAGIIAALVVAGVQVRGCPGNAGERRRSKEDGA